MHIKEAASLPDATPEGEMSALSAVYKFVLNRHKNREAATAKDRLDDAKGRSVSEDFRAECKYT